MLILVLMLLNMALSLSLQLSSLVQKLVYGVGNSGTVDSHFSSAPDLNLPMSLNASDRKVYRSWL